MSNYLWYGQLLKPSWAPPAWLFGPVWTVLYIGIFVSFGFVILRWFNGKISYLIALPFILNIIFNLAFTPILFGMHNLQLAAVDVLLVLATLIWSMVVIWPVASWVALVNIPYLLWVSFASVLQLVITYKNLNN